jgi:hypothetical protein
VTEILFLGRIKNYQYLCIQNQKEKGNGTDKIEIRQQNVNIRNSKTARYITKSDG